jgi:hypothetical protein
MWVSFRLIIFIVPAMTIYPTILLTAWEFAFPTIKTTVFGAFVAIV